MSHRAYRLWGGHVLPVICSSSARHHIRAIARAVTSEIGNACTGTQRFRSATEIRLRSGNNPNKRRTAARHQGRRRSRTHQSLLDAARLPCCSKTTASKSLRAERHDCPYPTLDDWKLTILFCCDSVVKRGLRSRYAWAVYTCTPGATSNAPLRPARRAAETAPFRARFPPPSRPAERKARRCPAAAASSLNFGRSMARARQHRQRQQHRRRVRRSAAQSRAHGDALGQPHLDPARGAHRLQRQPRRARHQVVGDARERPPARLRSSAPA